MDLKTLTASFAGSIFALISAGFLWIIRAAFEKHKTEVLALARSERLLALNLTALSDNVESIKNWIEQLKSHGRFKIHVETFATSDEETYKLSDLGLITKILSTNHRLRRTEADLKGVFSNYWENVAKIEAIPDSKIRDQALSEFHEHFSSVLLEMVSSATVVKNDIVDTVALIRVRANIRKHSIFGYVAFLFTDIFPRVTITAIDREKEELETQIKERGNF